MTGPEPPAAPTPRARRRETRLSVRVNEVLSRLLITFGGLGTIVAVTLIFLFLVQVAAPLFRPAEIAPPVEVELEGARDRAVLHLAVDEYLLLASVLYADGTIDLFELSSGRRLDHRTLFDEELPTASFFSGTGDLAAFGFADGRLRLARLGFETTFLEEDDVPADLRDLGVGECRPLGNGLVQLTPERQVRRLALSAELEDWVETGGSSPIQAVAQAGSGQRLSIATLDQAGVVRLYRMAERTNFMTGETELVASEHVVGDLRPEERRAAPPGWLVLSGQGDNLYLIWPDGFTLRLDARDPDAVAVAEKLDLAPEPGAELTSARLLLGGSTLLTGDDRGQVRAWFRIRPEEPDTPDGSHLVLAHELQAGVGRPVQGLAASARTRILAAVYEGGQLALFHVTSSQLLGSASLGGAGSPDGLLIAPKDDALAVLQKGTVSLAAMNPRHPEASWKALFGRVWYEGSARPAFVWQSSSGTDDFEPKLGLVPLVFGTLKATFYTMLFGAPIALLAALFTSEFLSPRLRGPIKSTIEMMASLPSVVLGFLAAIVVAPLIQPVVPGVLAVFFTGPLALLLGAHLWQIAARGLGPPAGPAPWLRLASLTAAFALPAALVGSVLGPPGLIAGLVLAAVWTGRTWKTTRGLQDALDASDRLVAVALILAAAVVLSLRCVGPALEGALFGGDLKHWLHGEGGPFGGWVFLLFPLSALATAFALGRTLNPWLIRWGSRWSRARSGAELLLEFLFGTVMAALLAAGLALLLTRLGLDPRTPADSDGISWTPMGTYVQRNALIVGFIMGFAVIPIIYTIAEDALSSVPGHLRLASLGAGATPWQTAMRVIVPTAMSGLFSALMVGLGRAVGETMIVLMATGNTPILDMNVFNGFRTLSANIAVELPEAPPGTTHYRTLFLAALCLFAMTFVVNTVAEVVRQHFRKRAYEL